MNRTSLRTGAVLFAILALGIGCSAAPVTLAPNVSPTVRATATKAGTPAPSASATSSATPTPGGVHPSPSPSSTPTATPTPNPNPTPTVPAVAGAICELVIGTVTSPNVTACSDPAHLHFVTAAVCNDDVNVCGFIPSSVDVQLLEPGFSGSLTAVDSLPFVNEGAPGCASELFGSPDNTVDIATVSSSKGAATYDIEIGPDVILLGAENQCTIEFTDGTNDVYLSLHETD